MLYHTSEITDLFALLNALEPSCTETSYRFDATAVLYEKIAGQHSAVEVNEKLQSARKPH